MAKTITFISLLTVFFWQPTTLTARSLFPLEMLYVQTDKQTYFTGENIWFRAYLVNPVTLTQSTTSRYIHAELINSEREVVNRVMIRHDENGVFAGHIPLSEDLEAGSYILRFFTRHLENFGEEYFFQRVIQIITPQSLEERRLPEQVREDYLPEERISAPIPTESFAVSFHPEGGDIPIGIETLIAFNAINSSGLGEHIHGVIINARGDTITHIESAHLGMGSFELMANSDEQFFAIVRNAAGIEKTFELPRAKEDAISLQIFRYDENIVVYLFNPDNRALYLTLQYRGHIIYSQRWNNESNFIFIPEEDLPTGVVGIVLSDEQGIPLSKRQIFNINRLDIVNTTFTTDRDTYDIRERVNVTVSITDNEGRPLRANFSISVIDNDITNYDASVNILSTLLLTSELRGHIENPAYYFMAENQNAKEHLDLVMLTHGWTRFDINRIYQEEPTTEWIDFETSQTITGTLSRNSIFRQQEGRQVSLMAPLTGFFDVTYTDRNRRFRFENFEFPEGTGFLIAGSDVRRGEIYIDRMEFPKVGNLFIPPIRSVTDAQREEIRRLMQEEEEDDIWSMELDEFVVTARPLRRRELTPEQIERLPWQNMFLFLEFAFEQLFWDRVRNVLICNHRPWIYALAPYAFRRVNEPPLDQPLIVIDGIQLSCSSYLSLLHPRQVESVEIVERHSTTSHHSRTIFITTWDGRGFHIRNNALVTPLGYQISQEFFSPAYTTAEQKANEEVDLRTTIFWNPSVVTGEDGKAELYFYTSDNIGNYVVVIEGITDEGRIVHSVSRLM